MARIRSLKPEAFESESLAMVSVEAERTFYGMSTIADDRGRLADKPAQINGQLWSMRGGHSREDLEAELAEMAADGVDLVCRYFGCDGKRYLHLVTWDGHQKIDKPSKSRNPRCPVHQAIDDYCGRHEGDCPPLDPSRHPREPSRALDSGGNGHRPGNGAHGVPGEVGSGDLAATGTVDSTGQAADQQLFESSRALASDSRPDRGSRIVDLGSRTGTEAGASAAAAGKPPRGTRIPDPFTVTPAMVAFVRDRCPHVDGSLQTEKFVNYWTAKAGRDATKTDWVRTWQNWMLTEEERAPRGGNGRGQSPDDRVRGHLEAGREAQAILDAAAGGR